VEPALVAVTEQVPKVLRVTVVVPVQPDPVIS
jgi:hypothetical protein